MLQQNTNHILMVRPANFGFNAETAVNNAFQTNDKSLSQQAIKAQAIAEFDQFVAKLRAAGVQVVVAQDSDTPIKPDAVFPNNWITFHPNGAIILYPMFAPTRRLERQAAIIDLISSKFHVKETYDISNYEQENIFLEGTGSMIFDRPNQLVYACLSPRTDAYLLNRFCKFTGYQKVLFHSTDDQNQDIYHTNVMMAMGETFVVISMETIKDPVENQMLRDTFARTGKEIIDLTMAQINAFAGNMLQVANQKGEGILVMSSQAYHALTTDQISRLEAHTQLLHSDITTIETYGGGSARCMMAEIMLAPK